MVHKTTLHASGDKGLHGTQGPHMISNVNIVNGNDRHKSYSDLSSDVIVFPSSDVMASFLPNNNKEIDVFKESMEVVSAKKYSNLPPFAYP